jgi:hypothetical protein
MANLQRWVGRCIFEIRKSAISWAQSAISNLQILRYVSPQISFD